MAMSAATAILISSAISGAFTAGSGILGASNSRNRAARAVKAQERANLINRFNRAQLLAAQDRERIKLHNYKVDRYKAYIPQAFNRANLAYQDNNAALTELIDQYQFQGQDRLAQSVAQRGALAARGMTGRGAATQDVALDSGLGRGDQLMSRNLLAARYGTERANQRIRQQLTDNLMNAYNQVGYTPSYSGPGMLGMAGGSVEPSFNNNDFNVGAFGAALQGFGTAAAGAVSAAAYPKPTNNTPPPVPELKPFQGPFIPGQPSTYLPGPINTKLPNL